MLPESRKFGLDARQAREEGVFSGVERARQLIRNQFVFDDDIRSMVSFYNRFKNCKTPKCEGAILLWGGRRFLQELSRLR